MRLEQILVPLDFSSHSAAALEHAIDLARHFEAQIHLLHCYSTYIGAMAPYGLAVPENFERECREAAVGQVEQWAQKVRAAGLAVETSVDPAPPAEAIVGVAERIGADLIVMGSRGLTGLKHVLLGSVTERSLRAASCPVLVVKDGD